MSRYRAIACGALVCIAAVPALAAPIVIVDQQNLVGGSEVGFGPAGLPTVGQSFTATLDGIDAVEFNLRAPIGTASVSVNLLDGVVGVGGEDGSVIGTTSTINLPLSTEFATYHFDFGTTVSLVPSNAYVLQLVGLSGNPRVESNPITSSPNPYSGGTAMWNGLQFADQDLLFSEGLHVPEPATVLLAAIGSLCTLVYGWRRR